MYSQKWRFRFEPKWYLGSSEIDNENELEIQRMVVVKNILITEYENADNHIMD